MVGIAEMPKSVAQLTGILVTAIVTFGTDLELTYAMLLGVCAGALATFFVSLAEGRIALKE
jgi:hypothetical protein